MLFYIFNNIFYLFLFFRLGENFGVVFSTSLDFTIFGSIYSNLGFEYGLNFLLYNIEIVVLKMLYGVVILRL